ncbi:MAG: TIGR03089 family protein [Aeromicrobium sp.]
MSTLDSLLSDIEDPAQPFVTYYDAATGERVELSGTTTANWVAKTSNFLIDSLDAEVGIRVRLGLPTHWESLVWILASWNVGAVLTDHEATIAVVGPELEADEETRVALSLKPMGLRFNEAPKGFIDFNAEVLGHSDYFQSFDPPSPGSLAIDLDSNRLTHSETYASGHPRADRVLLEPGTLARDCAVLISACRGSGSIVIAANADSTQLEKIAADERASAL